MLMDEFPEIRNNPPGKEGCKYYDDCEDQAEGNIFYSSHIVLIFLRRTSVRGPDTLRRVPWTPLFDAFIVLLQM